MAEGEHVNLDHSKEIVERHKAEKPVSGNEVLQSAFAEGDLEGGAIKVIIIGASPTGGGPTTGSATSANQTTIISLLERFFGTTVAGSQDISGISDFNTLINKYNSVTLIVEEGIVVFDNVSYGPGSYSWTASLSSNLGVMNFNASGSADAKLMTTEKL